MLNNMWKNQQRKNYHRFFAMKGVLDLKLEQEFISTEAK